MSTITFELVHGADGVVDVNQSLGNAESAILDFKVQRETEEGDIRAHLDTVFDNLRRTGAKSNMDFVINEVLRLMNISAMPAQYKELQTRVHNFIKANSQGKTDKDTKVVERPNSYLIVSRGKSISGSLQRRSDVEADAAAALAAEQAKGTTVTA